MQGEEQESHVPSPEEQSPDLFALSEYGKDILFVDYDKEADVLYVSFGKPQKADDAIQGSDGIIRRKKGNRIVGLTILGASRFKQ